MRQQKGLQTVVIAILAVAIVVMSVGFALYSQTLTIGGTATFQASNWKVRFDRNSYQRLETSTVTPATQPSFNEADNTTNPATPADINFTYTVTLPKPGDTYAFKVKAHNYGTIAAALKSITMTGLTAEQAKYISYKVSYAGTEYTSSADGLNVAMAAGAEHEIIVTVSYILPANASELPETDQTVTLNADFNYESAE